MYSITGTLLANTKYDLADPYNATINVWPSVCVKKGRGVVLRQPVCSGLNCAISLGRDGPGSCFTPSGLLSVKLCHLFGERRAGELFYTNWSAQCQPMPFGLGGFGTTW